LPKDGENKQFETFSQFVNRIVGVGNEKESAIKNDSTLPNPKANNKKKAKPSPEPEVIKFDINQSSYRINSYCF
jgi:hypothetical protein